MALVREVTKEIECFFPILDRALHRSLRKLLYYGEHPLYNSVFIAEHLGGFLGMMMRATARSLGFMRRVNALRLVRFNSIFHNYFSSPVMHLALSIFTCNLPDRRLRLANPSPNAASSRRAADKYSTDRCASDRP